MARQAKHPSSNYVAMLTNTIYLGNFGTSYIVFHFAKFFTKKNNYVENSIKAVVFEPLPSLAKDHKF
jgi:hypothetical protein